jgi:hypothetical protein
MNITYKARKGGNAIYWDMKPVDQLHIISQLEKLMIEVTERSISRDPLDMNLTAIWTANGSGLGWSPQHNCENTIASVVGGILKNQRNGTRDLTDKNCEKIEAITSMINHGIQSNLFPNIKISEFTFVEQTKIVSDSPFANKALFE